MGNREEMKLWHILQKNRQLVVYLVCSLITTLGEMAIGWAILRVLPDRIVIANTIALVLGAFAHYFLVNKYAFRVRHTIIRAGVYAGTFLVGLLIQNTVVLLMYRYLLESLSDGWQYLLSKIGSMAVALILTYIMRDWMNEKINKMAQNAENQTKMEEA